MTVCALVGGQFGSEGKGLIAGHIAKDYDTHVRVGAANAGHTVWIPKGSYRVGVTDLGDFRKDVPLEPTHERHVMQQIPCAAYANPDAQLVVGPGALISPGIFLDELELLAAWRYDSGLGAPRVMVDARAHIITDEHISREQQTNLAERIGSTSTIAKEGIGSAQAARVMRDESVEIAADFFTGGRHSMVQIRDVPMMLRGDLVHDNRILLEGTQGAGLSLTTGRHPYVTSRNTTAAGLCADAGVAPGRVDRVILVVRTFPIRVAGNSGPFYRDSIELDWAQLDVDPESERTTVTKKVRRVATFSLDQLEEAVVLNGATEIALTFGDYMSPRLKGVTSKDEFDTDSDADLLGLIHAIETVSDVPVTMIGTGPYTVVDWSH